jgi:hypothetical protein
LGLLKPAVGQTYNRFLKYYKLLICVVIEFASKAEEVGRLVSSRGLAVRFSQSV